MSNVGSLENHRFRRKLVEIRRVNLYAPVASKCIGPLLVGQKENQVRLAFCGHDFFRSRTKSALGGVCNDSAVAVALRATRALPTGKRLQKRARPSLSFRPKCPTVAGSRFPLNRNWLQMISRDSSTPLGMT